MRYVARFRRSGGNDARVQRVGLPPASSTAVAAVARAVDRVALDKEFVLLRGLIEIAQRRMQYTSITDEKGAAIKVRKAGRREMAFLLARPFAMAS